MVEVLRGVGWHLSWRWVTELADEMRVEGAGEMRGPGRVEWDAVRVRLDLGEVGLALLSAQTQALGPSLLFSFQPPLISGSTFPCCSPAGSSYL